MPTYVSLIRGINVAGNKSVKMESLKRSYIALGFRNVETYIQSGNVIFDMAAAPISQLAEKIEKRLLKEFDLDVSVVIRTPLELQQIAKRNPFLKDKEKDSKG